MTNVIQVTDLLAPETVGVSTDSNSGVTKSCGECGKAFTAAIL